MFDGGLRDALPEPGARIANRYRVERVLGVGAAVVYLRARDGERGEAQVVVHRYRPRAILRDAEWSSAAAWFLGHVAVLKCMSHRALNTFHAAWVDEQAAQPSLYLVSDFVPGNTLDQELTEAEEPLSWRQVVDIGVSLAAFQEFLHAQATQPLTGVLRPQRIVLDTRNGLPMLVGVGIDDRLDAGINDRPGYTPFEQWIGRPEPHSDIYALGMILATLLTNLAPDAIFSRLRRSGLDVQRSMRATAQSMLTLPPGTPPALAEILSRAMAFTAQDRFQSAGEFAAALRALRGPDVESVSSMVAEPEEGPVWERLGMTREAFYALPVKERNALVLRAYSKKPSP